MKTIVQTEANCNAHATARCIYRLFKYLVDKGLIDKELIKKLNITLTEEQKRSYVNYVEYKKNPSGTNSQYDKIEDVESNQLELYNSLVPILTYNYYVLELLYNENYRKIEMINNKSIAYIGKLVKDNYSEPGEKYEYREVNTTDHKNFATDNIIDEILKSQIFKSMKANKLNENNLKEKKLNENILKEKKLNENKSNCNTDKDCVNEKFENFYQYMRLIPNGYYMKKSSYKYSGDITNVKNINCKWIEPLIKILNKPNAFGLLGYKTDDISHAVAISSIDKVKDEDKYIIRYKNSWGVEFGNDGIDEMVITNETDFLEYYNIVVWTCEKESFDNEVKKLRTTTKNLFYKAKENNHEYAYMYIPDTFIFMNEDFRTNFFKKPSDESEEYKEYKNGNMTYFIKKLTDHMNEKKII